MTTGTTTTTKHKNTHTKKQKTTLADGQILIFLPKELRSQGDHLSRKLQKEQSHPSRHMLLVLARWGHVLLGTSKKISGKMFN